MVEFKRWGNTILPMVWLLAYAGVMPLFIPTQGMADQYWCVGYADRESCREADSDQSMHEKSAANLGPIHSRPV